MAAFSALLKRFDIEHEVVTEQWPKVGTMDLTSHVAALKAAKPDLIFSSLLFADLPVFMKQAHAAGLTKDTKLVFPAAGFQHTLMKKEFTPEGMLFGHNTLYFDNPEGDADGRRSSSPGTRTSTRTTRTGRPTAPTSPSPPTRPRVETAAKAKGGAGPSNDDVIDAMDRPVGRKPRRQGLLAQGPHRRPDLRAGLHDPQEQVRLRHARPAKIETMYSDRPAEAGRARISGSGSKTAQFKI